MATARVIKSGRRSEIKGEIKAASREVRLSALKGLEALPAATRVATVYSLLYDSDTRVRAVARKELLTLPSETLKEFVDGDGHAKVLDFLIRNLPKSSLTLPILVSAPNLAHRTRQFVKTLGLDIPEPTAATQPPSEPKSPLTVPPARPSETPGKKTRPGTEAQQEANGSSDSALDVDLEWKPPSSEDFDLPEGVEFSMPVVEGKKEEKASPVQLKKEVDLGDTSPALPLRPTSAPKPAAPPPPPAKPISAVPPPPPPDKPKAVAPTPPAPAPIPKPAPEEREHDFIFKPIAPSMFGKIRPSTQPTAQEPSAEANRDPFQPIPPSRFAKAAPPSFKPPEFAPPPPPQPPSPPKPEPVAPAPVIETKVTPPEPTLRPPEPEAPEFVEQREVLPPAPQPEVEPPAIATEAPAAGREISDDGVLFPTLETQKKAAQKVAARVAAAPTAVVATSPVAAVEKPVHHNSFLHGLLAGVLIGGIILIGYVTISRYLPGLMDRISSPSGPNNPPATTPPPPTPPAPAPPQKTPTPPAHIAPQPVAPPRPSSGEPVDLFLGSYRSMSALRKAQKKAEELGLVTEYSKKDEEQSSWSVSTGASGTREDADRKARGIRSLGIPAHVSGGSNGRWGISCGSASTQEAAQKRSIALRASGYGGHVSQNKRKQTTYTLRAKNVPANKKDEILEKLKEAGFRARER